MIWMYSPARTDIGLGRRAVDADILHGSASGSGNGVSFGLRMRLRLMCTRIGVAVACAPASIGSAGAATSRRPSRETVNSAELPEPGFAAEQGDGASAGKIDAATRKACARDARALAVGAQGALETGRVPVAADAQEWRIEMARRISRDKLASLHALDIDNAQMVPGPDRDGDDAAARHGVALLAGGERAQARLRDDGGPGRS